MVQSPSHETMSDANHNYERAEMTIARLKSDKIEDTLRNYEFWYSYYSKSSLDIVREVEILKCNNISIGEVQISELWQKYLFQPEPLKYPEKAGEVLRKAAEILSTMSIGEGRFSAALAIFGTVLDNAKTEEELGVAARVMAREASSLMAEKHVISSNLVTLSQEVENLKSEVDRLKLCSTTDQLTGLANRRSFDEKLLLIIEETIKTKKPLSVAFIDIDNFKQVNDQYGHDVGDGFLKIVASTIQSTFSDSVFSARNGGDEFALLMPGFDNVTAVAMVDVLRGTMDNREVRSKVTGQLYGKITISCGVSTYIHDEDIKRTLKRADNALYEAKRSGRNRVCFSV